jgi:hypothetical protein
MDANDADDLVQFSNVLVVRSTAPALLCRIGQRTVWLPRRHVAGKLWCTGDRGKLYVRRWVACDRQLIDSKGGPTPAPDADARLHIVRGRGAAWAGSARTGGGRRS